MKVRKMVSLIILMFILCANIVFAGDDSQGGSQLVDAAWDITNAILWIGYAVALGMVVFIGIKYITGAADAKANMKSAIVKYLIGALIVFSATTIASVVIKLAINGTDGGNGLASSIISAAEDAAK